MHSDELREAVLLTCLMEATARKPGNVHPGAAFVDLTWRDFALSAEAIVPVVAEAQARGVGQTVLDAIRATRSVAAGNINLGIVLLLAPLAAVPQELTLGAGIGRVLDELTREDAVRVYEAIRLAQPGGMGKVEEQDVGDEPTESLIEIMRMAAGRDLIAREYATGFELVLGQGVPRLEREPDFPHNWERGVIGLQLELMAREPDTLIARKCGEEIARESARRAQAVLQAGWPEGEEGEAALGNFDRWLRADSHRRNPGTTADLIAGCLFAAIRERRITPPSIEDVRQRAQDIAASAGNPEL